MTASNLLDDQTLDYNVSFYFDTNKTMAAIECNHVSIVWRWVGNGKNCCLEITVVILHETSENC